LFKGSLFLQTLQLSDAAFPLLPGENHRRVNWTQSSEAIGIYRADCVCAFGAPTIKINMYKTIPAGKLKQKGRHIGTTGEEA